MVSLLKRKLRVFGELSKLPHGTERQLSGYASQHMTDLITS